MANLTGKFITAATANKEINQFLKTRDESYYHIVSKLQSEMVTAQTLTYFTDNEISFIFDRALIEDLFKEIDEANIDCNALRVYYAADPGRNGSTTLVLVAAKYEKQGTEVVHVKNVFSPDPMHAGIEYPGGGLKPIIYPSTPDVDVANDDLNTTTITIL